MPDRRETENAAESLIDRLRGVDDDDLLIEVERLLDAHAARTAGNGRLMDLRDEDLAAVLRQLLGEEVDQPD